MTRCTNWLDPTTKLAVCLALFAEEVRIKSGTSCSSISNCPTLGASLCPREFKGLSLSEIEGVPQLDLACRKIKTVFVVEDIIANHTVDKSIFQYTI